VLPLKSVLRAWLTTASNQELLQAVSDFNDIADEIGTMLLEECARREVVPGARAIATEGRTPS
jgi:hypothetical protein